MEGKIECPCCSVFNVVSGSEKSYDCKCGKCSFVFTVKKGLPCKLTPQDIEEFSEEQLLLYLEKIRPSTAILKKQVNTDIAKVDQQLKGMGFYRFGQELQDLATSSCDGAKLKYFDALVKQNKILISQNDIVLRLLEEMIDLLKEIKSKD